MRGPDSHELALLPERVDHKAVDKYLRKVQKCLLDGLYDLSRIFVKCNLRIATLDLRCTVLVPYPNDI
jgi:hypothetical protein